MNAGIMVFAIGMIVPRIMAYVHKGIEETYHGECTLGDPLPAPDYAFMPDRNQYWAGAILERLRRSAERLLGVVDLDLFAAGLNFVFGQGDHRALARKIGPWPAQTERPDPRIEKQDRWKVNCHVY